MASSDVEKWVMANSDVENGSPVLATNVSDNEKDGGFAKSHQVWDCSDRIMYGAHIFWMLKEIGWVLLIPEICLPCGACAGIMMAYSVVVHCCRRPVDQVLCECVMCIWLCSNVIWMASEVLFDVPDAKFPWDQCPVVEGDTQSVYDSLTVVFTTGFLLGPGLYVLGLAFLLYRHRSIRSPAGHVLLQCYLCSWSLKDYFWAAEELVPAMSTDLISVPMLLYHIHLQTGVRRARSAGLAWIAWILSNGVWILGELQFPGMIGFNIAAACLLFVALLLLLFGYASYKESEQQVICNESSDEDSSSASE